MLVYIVSVSGLPVPNKVFTLYLYLVSLFPTEMRCSSIFILHPSHLSRLHIYIAQIDEKKFEHSFRFSQNEGCVPATAK